MLLARGATLTPNVAARLGWLDELQRCGRRRRARARAGRRRPAAAARGEDRRDRRLPAGSRRRDRRALHRSQVHAGAVRAGRSPGRLPASCSSAAPRPTSSWPPASATSRSPRACWTPTQPASPPASTSPAIRRCRPSTSTAGRSGSACLRTQVALKFGHRDVHDLLAARSPARVRFLNALLTADEHRGEGGARGGSVAPPFADAPGSRSPGARDLPRAVRRGRPDAHASGSTRPRPGSTAGRRCMPPAGWAACGWSSVCSRAAASRSTPGIRRIRARRSAGPRSDRCIAAPGAQITRPSPSGSSAAGADITAVGNGAGRTLLEMAQAIGRCRTHCGVSARRRCDACTGRPSAHSDVPAPDRRRPGLTKCRRKFDG